MPEYKQNQVKTFTFRDERSGKITILPIFDYLWDSRQNKFGAYGPHWVTYSPGYSYLDFYSGDNEGDDHFGYFWGKVKYFTYRTNNFDISWGRFSKDNLLTILLPEGLPIEEVGLKRFYLLFSKGSDEYKEYKVFELKAEVHFKYSEIPLKQKTKQAELEIEILPTLHDALEQARSAGDLQDYSFEECIFDYYIRMPFTPEECDASRVYVGGEYTGAWWYIPGYSN